ncbi:Dolichyl-diphosphooligosaccharide-protein glycosyltransferase 48kDa subunit [Neurospora crassa]|uniref:Dolichyl-diphosphooligosaccharide--protein glycosyltransferase subunit WBP1 n=1 Tax=Neurospora crassa (strain ATCC 24698 / 74-OR23-1A / CBS 708.71 / DSM 1257 / FGSC 987) TaxID=367110 RepID=Q7SHY4_NEUCR|nr:oligosaccharyl transferase subunit [Neurospora crassa OR74A]EAA36573.1 oligosaccharyl transferase subunit [Neurospora crassa OR74A]KHE89793.1 Dolichyl-diphosphooligosaccharide-protein glycosyltransferase 48kDa subunit [Neurospora crassa]|eukprot:XP_965809.1 oligosaccharyl transferase subunit [Neurospora crassa OR74A]
MRTLLSFLLLALASAVAAISTSGNRLLVVLDDVADKANYSKFFADLEEREFKITYETPKSDSLTLFSLGERTYDHVLFLPVRTKGLGPNLTPKTLHDFVNAKGNILLALSANTTTPTSLIALLSELDITLPTDRNSLVVDHFNYDITSATDKHDVLLLPPPKPTRAGIKDFFSEGAGTKLIAFPRGVGAVLGNGQLLNPILRAPRTAYSYNPKEQVEAVNGDDLFAAGQQLSLVSTMQARNNARVTVVGSAEMLQDKWFDASVTKLDGQPVVQTFNREFAKRVSGWTFQEIGVLKVNWVEHHLEEEGAPNDSNPEMYRVKNNVSYTISLSEFAWDHWIGFNVPEHDEIQLEFSMLSPFHRLNLKEESHRLAAVHYHTVFTTPDQHGIFNFMVNYKRPFLSHIEEKNTVPVRHMAHNEWPRSYVISGAWPWIAGLGSTVVGFLGFVALWMYSAPVDAGKKVTVKKTQ